MRTSNFVLDGWTKLGVQINSGALGIYAEHANSLNSNTSSITSASTVLGL